MHTNPRNLTTLATPILLVAVLLAAGCTPGPVGRASPEAQKENKIEFTTMTHRVQFAAGATVMAGSETKELSDFFNNVAFAYGDQVTIDAGPRSGNASTDALAAKRLDAVAAALRKLRVRAQLASRPTVDGALARNGVVVTVGHYVVIGPNCPDRRTPEADNFRNTPSSNYSCATVTNLGLMVANPGDLLRGDTPGPADGDFAARGVQLYRDGTMSKSLKSELSGSSN